MGICYSGNFEGMYYFQQKLWLAVGAGCSEVLMSGWRSCSICSYKQLAPADLFAQFPTERGR